MIPRFDNNGKTGPWNSVAVLCVLSPRAHRIALKCSNSSKKEESTKVLNRKPFKTIHTSTANLTQRSKTIIAVNESLRTWRTINGVIQHVYEERTIKELVLSFSRGIRHKLWVKMKQHHFYYQTLSETVDDQCESVNSYQWEGKKTSRQGPTDGGQGVG